jgi:hypothetical protein
MTSLFYWRLTHGEMVEISIKIKSSSPHEGTILAPLHELYRNQWQLRQR